MSIEVRVTSKGERRYECGCETPLGRNTHAPSGPARTSRASTPRNGPIESMGAGSIHVNRMCPSKSSEQSGLVRIRGRRSRPSLGMSRSWRFLFSPRIGGLPIAQITPSDVQRLVSHWSGTLAPRTSGGTRLSCGLCSPTPSTPTGSAGLRAGRRSSRKSQRHNTTSFLPRNSIDWPRHSDPMTAIMVYVAAVLGVRWGEAAGLRVRDIDFLGAMVAIESQRTRDETGGW